DWWTPACAAIGLQLPYVPTDSFRERVGRLLGRDQPRGYPYTTDGTASLHWTRSERRRPPFMLRSVEFARGFPQRVTLFDVLGDSAMPVRLWTKAAPLESLQLNGAVPRDWRHIDGEHLHGLRECGLRGASANAVEAIG